MALHVEPILLLLAPFYWLGLDGPRFLLTIQAFVFALGAWPLYLIARLRLGDGVAWVISLAYLLYPALEAGVLFDFHALMLAPTFFLFALYFLEQTVVYQKPRWLGFSLFLILAVACKEDMGLTAAILGLYIFLAYRQKGVGLLIFGLGLGWTALCLFVIQPQFAVGGNIHSDRYTWFLSTLIAPRTFVPILLNHFQAVDLPTYLLGILLPVAGLALLSPLILLPTLPTLAVNLLSNNPFNWRLEEFHYAAPLAPFVFVATVYSLEKIKRFIHEEQVGLGSGHQPPLSPLQRRGSKILSPLGGVRGGLVYGYDTSSPLRFIFYAVILIFSAQPSPTTTIVALHP